MSAEAVKTNPPPSVEGERQRYLDREVRDMLSTLTSRLSDLQQIQKPGGSGLNLGDEDEQGTRIITIAGSNTGATMKGDLLERRSKQDDQNEASPGDDLPESWDTYVNSNFQAVNSSIMLGATYTSNDPGVHLDIVDVPENNGRKADKQGRRGVRKGKEPAQGFQQQSEFTE